MGTFKNPNKIIIQCSIVSLHKYFAIAVLVEVKQYQIEPRYSYNRYFKGRYHAEFKLCIFFHRIFYNGAVNGRSI